MAVKEDKNDIKDIETPDEGLECTNIEDEGDLDSDCENAVVENNSAKVVSTSDNKDQEDKEQDEPPATRRRVQLQRSKKQK